MEVIDPNTGHSVTVRMRRDLPRYNVTRARNSPRLRWSLPLDIQWQSECIMKLLGQNCACCDAVPSSQQPTKSSDDVLVKKSTPVTIAAGKLPVVPPGDGGGHDTVFVNSKKPSSVAISKGAANSISSSVGKNSKGSHTSSRISEKKSSTSITHSSVPTTESVDMKNDVPSPSDDISQRLLPLSVDIFPGFPLSPQLSGKRRMRRRRQLISTSDMLIPRSQHPEAEPPHPTKTLSAFDIMKANLAGTGTPLTQNDVTRQKDMTSQVSMLTGIAEEENQPDEVPDVIKES